jgi:hypothetical protein
MLKLSFIAPSCYGKSTAIAILSKYYDVKNIKLAKPLYDLQELFYRYLNMNIGTKQDGELLQFFGNKIRKENPGYIVNAFITELNKSSDVQLVTNDDCRPPDYPYLKNMGFKFVLLNGFKRDRDDHTLANARSALEWNHNDIEYDYVLDNLGTMEEYEENIMKLMKEMNLNGHVKQIRKN